jgi:pyruvate ferredoxin oxidoreductase gamma subunit
MLEIRIHGHGGQGTVTLAELVAFAQLKLGRYVQTLPFFGMERRGAPVKTAMRLSDNEIMIRSQVYKPRLLVMLSEVLVPSALQQGLHEQGAMLLNASGDGSENGGGNDSARQQSIPTCRVDAWGIARAYDLILMGQPLVNIPMFGAAARMLGMSAESVIESVKHKWPVNNDQSVRAALQGYEEVQGLETLPDADEWNGRMPA